MISEQHLLALQDLYREWRDDMWRRGLDGNNRLNPKKEAQVIAHMYEGIRMNELRRRGFNVLTLERVRERLWQFLDENPQFERPRCRCGYNIWHQSICPVWDTYNAPALDKGRETQARLRRERESDIFFHTIEQTKTMSTALTKETTIQEQAREFASLVQRGIDAWLEAGRLLVDMLDKDPEARSVIMESSPDITEEILARFEAIGRKQVHPKTLLNNSPGMRRLRNLPYSEQEKYIVDTVPVLIKTERGPETLNVAVKNLTPKQALQVMGRDGVRSPEAQRAWLESRNAKIVKNGSPYEVKGNRVIFHANCEMTAKELAQLLAKLS